MPDAQREAIVARLLQTVEQALRTSTGAAAERATYHCGRLAQALQHSHAEAIRFAAYTINHIMTAHPDQFSNEVRESFEELRQALHAAGHTF